MLMVGLNETIDLLAMASSVRWNGNVLRREDVKMRMELVFEVECQGMKGRPRRR